VAGLAATHGPQGGRRTPPPAGCHANAFTLIELLVVIAIVGILASLLLPALAKARTGAGTARCLGNLRQFALATEMYWDDHDGTPFPYRGPSTNGGDVFWFGWLERGEEGTRRFDPRAGALWPYLQGRGVEACPALTQHGPRFKPKAANGGACGYGYNLALSPVAGFPVVRPQHASRPCEWVVFADAAQVNDFQAPASPEHPMLEEFYYLNTGEPTAHFRHSERAATAFADGHAGRERAVPGSFDPRLPEARVGRLPNTLLNPP
jgi:prepilin-type N-terminal cleavage/methylation domain-containing protein/prepilin-type processing-associated H-X9-DG protein